MIRVDVLWLDIEPLDMWLAWCQSSAHDGIGVWLAARRQNNGKFVWPRDAASTASLSHAQFDALALGLPWQRLARGGVITVV